MKILILSDTHIRHFNQLPKEILEAIKQAEAVIHLGDYDTIEFVEELKSATNFYGVTGNHDNGKIKAVLPETDIVEISGKKIGLVHGHGCVLPLGLQYGLVQRFAGEKLDAILFGHTHISVCKEIDGTLFFNPGSVAGRFPAEQKSFGMLEVNHAIRSYIIPIKTTHKSSLVAQAYALAQEFSPREFYYRITTLY